jgi:hypothetical protein
MYLCLSFQATIIIAKLSFWIKRPFLQSVAEALHQYIQKGYAQKLKSDITPHLLNSVHWQGLPALLYRQV